jgi:hypothetical protein
MRDAIKQGNEESLAAALADASLWEPMETFVREGVAQERKRNIPKSCERLATTEFSTWYVRGLARRLMDAMGGRVWIEANGYGGSRFIVALPAADGGAR